MDKALKHWLERDPDPRTRAELQELIATNNRDELALRFSGRLEFGTAGLRGEVGVGPARMNRLVVQETSAGLGACLLKSIDDAAARGVLVAFDGRLDSRQFAQDTACVLAALGFKVYLTHDVAATPIGAFGVRHIGTAAAVVVTASHNPPQYNGYKVYWENGAQIIPPQDSDIAAEIDNATTAPIPWVDFDVARNSGKIEILGEDFYAAYRAAVLASPLFARGSATDTVSIAYTPLHGVGAQMAESLLHGAGFDRVYTVASQREPDGHFPTVNFPNPEEPGAMDAVIALAQEHAATLACANDPDADRLAVAARKPDGSYQMLTGDQVGVLLANYLLQGPQPVVPLIGTTIVSSSLLKSVAEASGARFYETLTGFKWLANIALQQEDDEHQFLFAYEEALGYAAGPLVRDKDGLSGLLAFAQMTAQLAARGETVFSQLEELYRRHGLHLTRQQSIAISGGISVGDSLRNAPPKTIAGSDVLVTDDLKSRQRLRADGSSESLSLPGSDVLIYRLANNARVIVRPSGTEPKLKCYYEIVEQIADDESYDAAQQRASATLTALVEGHQSELAKLLTR